MVCKGLNETVLSLFIALKNLRKMFISSCVQTMIDHLILERHTFYILFYFF